MRVIDSRRLALAAILAACLPMAAQAEEPTLGFLQLGYIDLHPDPAGGYDPGSGYSVLLARELPDDFIVLGEFAHTHKPAQLPAQGELSEDDYVVGGKYIHPLTEELRWVTALTYEQDRDRFAGATDTSQGYDFVQGLRVEASDRLELIADLHHSHIGSSKNALTLGLVYRWSFRFGGGLLYSRSDGAGLRDDTGTLFLRVYY